MTNTRENLEISYTDAMSGVDLIGMDFEDFITSLKNIIESGDKIKEIKLNLDNVELSKDEAVKASDLIKTLVRKYDKVTVINADLTAYKEEIKLNSNNKAVITFENCKFENLLIKHSYIKTIFIKNSIINKLNVKENFIKNFEINCSLIKTIAYFYATKITNKLVFKSDLNNKSLDIYNGILRIKNSDLYLDAESVFFRIIDLNGNSQRVSLKKVFAYVNVLKSNYDLFLVEDSRIKFSSSYSYVNINSINSNIMFANDNYDNKDTSTIKLSLNKSQIFKEDQFYNEFATIKSKIKITITETCDKSVIYDSEKDFIIESEAYNIVFIGDAEDYKKYTDIKLMICGKILSITDWSDVFTQDKNPLRKELGEGSLSFELLENQFSKFLYDNFDNISHI